MRLDNYLLRVFKDVPKSRVYKIIRSGEVRVNRGRAKPATRLAVDDEVRLPPVRQAPKKQTQRPPDELIERVTSAVVEETADYLLFAKPPGLAVHAGSGVRFGLIEVLRAARPDEYFELVHRLDRQTSGCLLVARSRQALDGLRAALNDAAADKRYLALVEGRWRHGVREVDAPLSRDVERAGERIVSVDHVNGRASLSVFAPRTFYRGATLMDVTIRSGRTHQIRVHAAHCGHPVAADDKYAGNAANGRWRSRGLPRMFLHAAQIVLYFQGQRRVFEAPLPADLSDVLAGLEEAA
ncbi:RluA family pseudouridine synthase [Salinisphaera sp. Q1T1-3]|uniref:RluA family pseudouridine synthase n=1 Tax=Salinisphaera sp. Q1T1-3 TaxID=2321229 RepID=UPI000E76A042|nr:RluA family pseudouridine synthase [Salinisphaera sp. Q1T1-3]RJS95369.1 RluA family pseudouridine synthase [Salinisphaera sp. Q1T1-3]